MNNIELNKKSKGGFENDKTKQLEQPIQQKLQ
jgi:hypothetical protein